MKDIKKGTFFEVNIKGLGEFKFLFSENKNIRPGTDKYFVESFWNPPNYGLVDFIVGYYTEDIEAEINSIIDDMSYFIDGARISCVCRIEEGNDNEGVYDGILYEWFSKGSEYCHLNCEEINCSECNGDDEIPECILEDMIKCDPDLE